MRKKSALYRGFFVVLVALGLVTGPQESGAEQGYRVDGNQIVVEGRAHWENWSIPTNLAAIDAEGNITSRTFRTVYNVLADTSFRRPLEIFKKDTRIANIDSTVRRNSQGEILLDTQDNPLFDYAVRPGVSRVGSNPHLADNIFDGDPTTYWEPNPADPLSQWWIEVDLGRVVPLEQLRLQFVDEDLGDPFLKFILLMSELQTPGRFEEGNLRFSRIVPFEAPNTEQRIFVFRSGAVSADLPPSDVPIESRRLSASLTAGGVDTPGGANILNLVNSESNLEWTGRKTETIRIVITDSRFGKAEQITQEQWQALPVGERGDIEYFVRDVNGREEPVDEDTYQDLDPGRQGRQLFYRRELPRLAEVGAWAMGDNLSLGVAQVEGSLSHTLASAAPVLAFDGDGASRYKHPARDPEKPDDNILIIDLGGSIWLSQIRYFVSGMRGYLMRGSSGVRDAQGELVWRALSPPEREKNIDNGDFTTINDVVDPPVKLRFLELTTFLNANIDNIGTRLDNFWPSISEVQIFSEGPTAEVVVESDLIELPGNFNFGAIDWQAETPPGTDLEIRTRTGNQLFQVVRYFKNSGEAVSKEEYEKLPGFLKGATDTTVSLGPDWSAWSQKYVAPGERVTSPSLRRFMQIQAKLVSDNRQDAAKLEGISVELHLPVAQELRAELWPALTQAGVLDTFDVFLQPGFVAEPVELRQPGFDEVLLRSEPRWDMELLEVAVGTEEEFEREEPAAVYDIAQEDGLSSVGGNKVELVRDRGDSVWVRFPRLLGGQGQSEPVYNRKLQQGALVPVATSGLPLTVTSHSQLPIDQVGPVRYFRLLDGGGQAEVDEDQYEALAPEERGDVRYFRVVAALGEESPFDDDGEILTAAAYNRLSADLRGTVVNSGDLVRLRFAARVFLQGSNVKVAVRNSGVGGVWQEAQSGDATAVLPGRGLEILAEGGGRVVTRLNTAPNPFTPNGDGINDQTTISFSLFRVHEARPVRVRLYSLDGRRVRSIEQAITGGGQEFVWDGRNDAGVLVPPGLYLAQVEVETDAEDAEGQQSLQLVGVVY